MNTKWKIAVVFLFLVFFWIRLSPLIPWTLEMSERLDWYVENQYYGCNEETARIIYEWSWWSLRFTDVSFDCDR